MATIDIGSAATNRASALGFGGTFIAIDNPANATGVLDTFEIWLYITNSTGVKVGTFSYSSPNATNRDYESIGGVNSGSKQTFTGKNCDVVSDDYVGIYIATNGQIERDTSGYSGIYYEIDEDIFGVGAHAVSMISGNTFSLYATGATVESGPTPAVKVGGAWKETTSQKIKIGGAWKTVTAIKQKIGGAWKAIS